MTYPPRGTKYAPIERVESTTTTKQVSIAIPMFEVIEKLGLPKDMEITSVFKNYVPRMVSHFDEKTGFQTGGDSLKILHLIVELKEEK